MGHFFLREWSYRVAFERAASDHVTLVSADGSKTVSNIPAKVAATSEEQLAGSTDKELFQIILSAHVTGGSLRERFGEINDGDIILMRDREYTIDRTDGHKRSVDGRTLAYELTVTA